MALETMRPDPTWDAASHADAVATLGREDLAFGVWGGDWCPDCRSQLPAFAAALDAAGVPAERIAHHPVEKTDDGKAGPLVEAYGIEYIPTVVVERVADPAGWPAGDGPGEELARFVEAEAVPIAVWLADRLAGAGEG